MLNSGEYESDGTQKDHMRGFSSVLGHEFQKGYLESIIRNKRVLHGYIFEGPEGIGKFKVASLFARMLLCKNAHTAPGCGVCSSCSKFDTSNHPDLMIVEKQGASQTIVVEQMNALQEFINIRPNENGVKVVVIRDAEGMNVASQNKILKVLEEPPGYAVIIFTSNNKSSLLPTVVSRSQSVSFFKLSNSDIYAVASILNLASSEKCEALINFADGSVGRLMRLLESEKHSLMREVVATLPQYIISKDFVLASRLLSEYTSKRDDLADAFRFLLTVFRDLMAINAGRKMEASIYNSDKKKEFFNYAFSYDMKKIIDSIGIVEEALIYLSSNVSPVLVADTALIKLQEVFNG
jgi:DNA polymerase III subunit delta'